MKTILVVIIGACASLCVHVCACRMFVRVCSDMYACFRQASVPTSWQWAPDSRAFMTATLFPRMRQDNRVQIFDYRGELVR